MIYIIVMMDEVTGRRVALVTGAASGIGRAVVLRLLAAGTRVACLDRVDGGAPPDTDPDAALSLQADVRDEAAVAEAVGMAHGHWGRLDLVVNAAGVGGFAHTATLALEEWSRILDVNLTGTFLVCKHALPLLEDGGGAIVNVASVAGLSGRAYGAAYSASKAGVVLLTRSLALEYGPRDVRVNCVCPGAVDTPLLDGFGYPPGADDAVRSRGGLLGRLAGPDEVASAVLWLASDEAGYVTGSSVVVDGGASA